MDFIIDSCEMLYDAFGIGVVPIGFGFLVFLIIALAIVVRIIKAMCSKLFSRKQAEKSENNRPYSAPKTTPKYYDTSKNYEVVEKKELKLTPQEEKEFRIRAENLEKERENKELKELIKKAESGDVEAQCECGRLYANGYIVREEEQRAFYWYEKAAQQGSLEGHFQLGKLYADEYYSDESKFEHFEEARYHLLIAAKENHSTSQNELAFAYCHKYTLYCEEKGYKTKEEREADPLYVEYVKKYRYWMDMFNKYNGLFAKEYIKSEQNFIE